MLNKERKHLKVPSSYPKPEDFKMYEQIQEVPAHDSTEPTVESIDIHQRYEHFILSGGADSHFVLYDM